MTSTQLGLLANKLQTQRRGRISAQRGLHLSRAVASDDNRLPGR
jgi:hypothetical protein